MLEVNQLIGFGAGGDSFQITNSFLTRPASNTYFSRTYGTPTDGKKFTLSFWIRRTELYATRNFQAFMADSGGNPKSHMDLGTANSGNEIEYATSGSINRYTTSQIAQTSTFVHVQFKYDSTDATEANRGIWYFDGSAVGMTTPTSISINATPSFAAAVGHQLFADTANGYYLAAYVADINYVDGLALDPSYFGELIGSAWRPKQPNVSNYGNNGFRLEFKDNSSTTALGYDTSGKGNHWTPTNILTSDQSIIVP